MGRSLTQQYSKATDGKMNHAKSFMRLRRPSNSSKDSSRGSSNDSEDELQSYSMLSDSYSESFLDLAVLPASRGSAKTAQWKPNLTPRSEGKSPYISKPRSSSKEAVDRRSCIHESLENAITPISRREKFVRQQQKVLEAHAPAKWNNLHDSQDQATAKLMQDSTPKSVRMSYQKDSSRTATTQNSSQSTITSVGSQSPYCQQRQSTPISKSRSAESSPVSPSQHKKPPPRSKSADSDSHRTEIISNKAGKGQLPPLQRRPSKSSSTNNPVDDVAATISLVLTDKPAMTPQGKQTKLKIDCVDVSPWLVTKANHKDGDGSDSRALETPIKTPPAKWVARAVKEEKEAMEKYENSYNELDGIKVAFSPDEINRSIEDQRALAKEMAEELAELPTSSELRKSKSWVSTERKNATLQTGLHGPKHSPPQLMSRPRMTGRRSSYNRAFATKKLDSDRPTNTSGHSRGMGRSHSYTGEKSLGGRRSQQARNDERKPPVRRTRSSEPLLEMSGHSRRSVESNLNRSSNHSRSGHSRSSHNGRHGDRSLNVSGHSTRSTDRHGRSCSPSEEKPRKAGRRPKLKCKSERVERSIEENGEYTTKSKRRSRSVSSGSSHGVTIQVSEHRTDDSGHRISIEVSGKLKANKPRDSPKYSALNRRREQRRKESGGRSQSPVTGQSQQKRSGSPKSRSQSPGHTKTRSQSPGSSPSMRASRRSPHQISRQLRRQRSASSEITSASTISSRSKEASRDTSRETQRNDRSPSIRRSPSTRSNSRKGREVTGGTTGGEHLFECSFNGGSQVIDLNEWDSESEASFKKKPSKMQSRTVSNDLVEDGTVVQKSSAHSAESARLYKLFNSGSIKPKSSSSMLQESNSIDVDNVISHMETLHDLEKLSNQKVQEQMKRYMDRRMVARGHLLQLMEHKMSVKDFREFYGITFQETKKLVDHVKLCLKMNEEIRWDLVFHILLSDGGMSPYG